MDYAQLLTTANFANAVINKQISDIIQTFSDKNVLNLLSDFPPRIERNFQVKKEEKLVYKNDVLSFGEKKITRITEQQKQFLEIIFQYEVGANIPTIEIEKVIYGDSLSKKSQENMKKFTNRLDAKVKETFGISLVKYGTTLIYRKN